MDIRNCLFVQWKSPTDASRYVFDGSPCVYTGTELQDEIMKLFSEVPKFKEICRNKNRDDLSPSFRCSYTSMESEILYFIEGNFEEKDLAGRKLVYIFATHEDNPKRISEILKQYSSLLNVTPHAEDLEEIETLDFKKKILKNNHKTILWIIVTTITLLLLFILLNH